jgi:hypothetical protein
MPELKLSFSCLALLALASLGCGGTVETGSAGGGAAGSAGSAGSAGIAGTAGTGATGATGGAAGTGGSSGGQGTCSPEEKGGAYDGPPDLGFKSPPGSPMSAVVVTVTESSLEYNLGPGGPVELFSWRGPPLTDVFKDGDTVTVGVSQGWHFVANEKVAAAYADNASFVPPDVLPAVPMSKTPPLSYTTQCAFPEGVGDCGQPPADVRVLAVHFESGKGPVDVAVGETVAAGELQVHNAQSVALPGYGSNDCVLEALFMSGVTVLTPVGK